MVIDRLAEIQTTADELQPLQALQGMLVLLKVDRRVLLLSQTTGRAGHRMETLAEITETIGMPWYKEWTGKDASKIPDNVGHVYKEFTGKIDHSMLGRANTPDAMGPYGPSRGVDVAGK